MWISSSGYILHETTCMLGNLFRLSCSAPIATTLLEMTTYFSAGSCQPTYYSKLVQCAQQAEECAQSSTDHSEPLQPKPYCWHFRAQLLHLYLYSPVFGSCPQPVPNVRTCMVFRHFLGQKNIALQVPVSSDEVICDCQVRLLLNSSKCQL